MKFDRAVPVMQVADVARSMAWYADALGFTGDPFPERPPHSFAILRRDEVELMLQKGTDDPGSGKPGRSGWTVYLRLEGGKLLSLAEAVKRHTPLLRGPERMFYGQVEFEVSDPDGHRLCVSELLGDEVRVAPATE